MKNTDRQILNALRKNGRESISRISRRTGIPISTVFAKIKDHEKDAITRHVSLLDFQNMGYHHQNLLLKMKKDSKDEKRMISDFIKKCRNINNAFEINGEHDFLIETVHKGLKDYFRFKKDLESFEGIERIEEYFVMDEIKREGFFED